jgi:hypothetical protein
MLETVAVSSALLVEARQRYERDGFCIAPPLIPEDLIRRVPAHMDAVLAGHFETGRAAMWQPEESPTKVRIIDQPHVADRTIYDLVSYPAIGRFAAAITGAQRVQVWAVSLIYKPTGGDTLGGIGWHQDMHHWREMWEEGSETLTAWVAVSDVTLDAGPLQFVPGSHRWGILGQGDFGNPNQAAVVVPEGKQWREVAAPLPPGAATFHHGVTYHGSGRNISAGPRLGFALHLRTERATPLAITPANPGYEYLRHLDDQSVCPVLYGADTSV